MKSLICTTLLLVVLVSGTNALLRVVPRGPKFSSVDEEASEFAQLSLPLYTNRLAEALVHDAGNQDLAGDLAYYRALSSSLKYGAVPDVTSGTVHDCVPFEMQPALLGASLPELQEARSNWWRATRGAQTSTAEAICEAGMVPIPRPVVRYGRGSVPKAPTVPLKEGTRYGKQKSHISTAAPTMTNAPSNYTDPYSYVNSPNIYQKGESVNYTYVVLGLGKAVNSSLPEVPLANPIDHSVNQLWWGDSVWNATLETGWIRSIYWSVKPVTMLFAFSTPDNYGNSSYDRYNYKGGFIGYPGAPALAKSIGNFSQYLWKYEKVFSANGTETTTAQNGTSTTTHRNPIVTSFDLKLTPFTGNVTSGFTFGPEIPVGYYPVHRYQHGVAPDFNTLQAGCELMQIHISNSTDPKSNVYAGGKIFGWGTNTEKYRVEGNFSAIGNPIHFYEGAAPGFTPSSATSDHFVGFTGTMKML